MTDPDLKTLTDQFVRVRMTQMGGVDLATFQFDPMLSWAVVFMHADKTIYGRFGRAHPQTKRHKRDSNPNPTIEGLRAAAQGALELHAAYTLDPKGVGARLATKTGPEPRWRFAEKTPAALKYGRLKRVTVTGDDGCVHCHEVLRTAIDSHFMKRKPVPDRMLWLYPRPHVLGLAMDNRQAARVVTVAADSPAARAGIKPGDDLISVAAQPLLSIADLQWVLHTTPDDGGTLAVRVQRGDAVHDLSLELAPGWRRQEDFVWRYRMAGYASWLWAGHELRSHPKGVHVGRRTPHWFKKGNPDAMRNLRGGDVITHVDGTEGMDRSTFLAYLMREKRLGSSVRLKVLRGGKAMDVSFKIPKKQPEVQGH